MAPPLISAVGNRVADVAGAIFRLPLATLQGGADARALYRSGTALPALEISRNSGSISNFVSNCVQRGVGYVGGEGAVALRNAGFMDKIVQALNGNFGPLGKILASVSKGGIGLSGGLLVAGAVGLGLTALTLGLTECFRAWGKVSNLKKNYSSGDTVQSSLVHGIQAFAGLTTALGGVAMFIPGLQSLGAATVAAGFAGSIAMGITKYCIGGFHWFRYPDTAPYPFNLFFRLFANKSIYSSS